jgi:hypothetical protein
MTILLEHFKETLRQICVQVENQAIENRVYFDAILERGGINLPNLREKVVQAQADPAIRKEVHMMFSGMWKGLDESGIAAFGEGLLEDLPPTDTPN